MKLTNVMLDLETLGSSNKTVVVSIGAVYFDPNSDELGPTFYSEMIDDLSSQTKAGRILESGSVLWWMQQPDDARAVFEQHLRTSARRTTTDTLDQFRAYLQPAENELCLWGNGADFDNAILGSLYEDMKIKRPWSFSQNRCYRTMRSLRRTKKFVKPNREGIRHHALDDAVFQAQMLQAIMKDLRNNE